MLENVTLSFLEDHLEANYRKQAEEEEEVKMPNKIKIFED
jgi:hypothetical protein